MDIATPVDHRVTGKKVKREISTWTLLETKKRIVYEGDTKCNWCARNNPKNLSKGTGRHGNKRTSADHPNIEQSLKAWSKGWES